MCPDEPVWPAPSSAAAVPIRRVRTPLSSDNSLNQTGFTDCTQRFGFQLPAGLVPIQCRLFIGNGGIAFAGQSITLTDLFMGTPTFNAQGQWGATGAGANLTDVLALSGTTLPTDGSDLITSWFTPPALWTPGQQVFFGLGFTVSAGTVSLTKGGNTGMCWTGAGAAASTGNVTPTGALSTSQPLLDIRLEYRVQTNLGVVLFVLDSLGSGYEGTVDPSFPGPMATWPAMAGMVGRFLWINGGVGGSSTSNWNAGAYRGWSRINAWLDGDLGSDNAVPDQAVNGLGVNDISLARTQAAYLLNQQTINGLLQGIGVRDIRGVTLFPQGRWKPGVLMASAAVGAVSLQTSIPYASGDSLEIDHEFSAIKETLVTTGASTGTQPPFATPVPATTRAHDQGAVLGLSGSESLRLDYIAGQRQVPGGWSGILDAAQLLAAPGTKNVPNPVLYRTAPPDTSSIHPGVEAYALLAQLGAVLG